MFGFCLTLVSMATVAFGCSPPEGGFILPEPAEKVSFSDYVVIGEVRSILQEDPLYGDMYGSTYGAEVHVQCSYKGDVLPGFITIGGAGFIPGLCTAKELEQGKKYLLFLSKKTTENNETVYEQGKIADEYYKITNYLDVCGLKMIYPEENGFPLKRQVCEYEKDGPCKAYNSNTGEIETKGAGTQPTQATTASGGKNTVTAIGVVEVDQNTTVKDGDNGSSGLRFSFGVLLLSVLGLMV